MPVTTVMAAKGWSVSEIGAIAGAAGAISVGLRWFLLTGRSQGRRMAREASYEGSP